MAPITATIVPLLTLCVGSTTAFVTPTGRGASWSLANPQHTVRSSTSAVTTRHNARRQSSATPATSSLRMVSEVAEQKAAKLRETAAAFRAEAAELEEKQARETRENAQRSFNTFDSNKDGSVDVAELKAGLEGPLRRSFTKTLQARMGRKPSKEEVDDRIAGLPGGTLFPDDLALKLIQTYDQNGDGLLQQSEFAPTEELRTRLENLFSQQREEERVARMEERQRQMDDKMRPDAGAVVVSPGDVNDGPATTADKALSALPYVLPLADGVVFAAHLFGAFPEQTAWAQPLAAVLLALRSVPFATLIGFFSLSIGSSNPQINKLVRFNMQQAINLDIALILLGVMGAITVAVLGSDAFKLAPLANAGSDMVFVALLAAVAYSVGTSATGSFPNKLPLLGRLNRENPDNQEGGEE
ncbi:unnamed protein product [Ectocarpus sp. 12 AP-2014]